MSVLIYSEQAGDKLKLLAEVDDDNVELAVDALLDAEPKFANQQPFVCFPSDARMIVEAGDIVRPRRDIRITNGTGTRRSRTRTAEPEEAEPEAAEEGAEEQQAEATPRRRRGRPPGRKSAAKPSNGRRRSAKKPAARKPAAKKGASPFKRNPKSDE
jgi:hypothetical protein